ncbi:hypothetical protein BYT27DRAFT_6420940 [Phlegmacium glaucopus]|nr:hypothetical protein BYT27DRAFT_6420940 [Phlegmacium glaucopus]
MSGPAAFSRLQLAAALLEYDNDPDDPNAPYRSAQDSAIFAHFLRNPAARPELHKTDYLGVPVPSDAGSLGGRESALEARRSRGSRGSMDALRNPFGMDYNSDSDEDDRDEQVIEVDLASWGLDAFIPKERSKSAKSKGKQPLPPPITSTRSHRPSTNYDAAAPLPRRGVVTSRPLSAGGNLDFATEHTHAHPPDRRRSFGSPLDLVGMEPIGPPLLERRRVISQASIPHSMEVPFPSSSLRSPSPGVDQLYGDPRFRPHERTLSMASMSSRLLHDDMKQEYIQPERSSSSVMGLQNVAEDNPFAIHHPSHISRFDPKVLARTRTQSSVSMGSRMILENDNVSVMTEARDAYSRKPRYSTTMDLLRPKVLVMPSPLQAISPNVPEQPIHTVRDGFELSTDGPPLPPGARSSRRLSISNMETEFVPLASNSFIPNPHIDLSLSQKTFRNTLVVGGQSGAPFDAEEGLPRATEDGQQILVEDAPKVEDIKPLTPPPEEDSKALRPAGKLYGKSLIDDLEHRKAQMRSKQRVFTGDERPSMMAREQRASTLIDPASLQARPISKRLSSYGSSKSQQALGRQNSLTMKPLLNFEDEDDKNLHPLPAAGRLPPSRTVFGVDTLWEREMAKLKEIEAREAREKEERLKREEERERKNMEKKSKHKRKARHQKGVEDVQQVPADARVSVEPPTLPDIQRATRSVPPRANDSSYSTSESEEEDEQLQPRAITPGWHENSSDDGDAGPRRTTGVGLRYPRHSHKLPISHDNDSEEDLPLAATIHKAIARAALGGTQLGRDSDDEDQPLSRIVRQAKAKLSPPRPTYAKNQPADDDDDQPLGLRTSRFVQSRPDADDEDDLPLAFHPEQQRRTQYQMLAQQQHQQQMMMQAQMQSNMLMNASMMGPGYFAPLVNPMGMMQVPMPMPSPPPIHDEVKFGRVDRWRRDIVVDE